MSAVTRAVCSLPVPESMLTATSKPLTLPSSCLIMESLMALVLSSELIFTRCKLSFFSLRFSPVQGLTTKNTFSNPCLLTSLSTPVHVPLPVLRQATRSVMKKIELRAFYKSCDKKSGKIGLSVRYCYCYLGFVFCSLGFEEQTYGYAVRVGDSIKVSISQVFQCFHSYLKIFKKDCGIKYFYAFNSSFCA